MHALDPERRAFFPESEAAKALPPLLDLNTSLRDHKASVPPSFR